MNKSQIAVTPAMLASTEAFNKVPEMQLKWLIDNSRNILLEAGKFLFIPGKQVDDTYIIIDGKIRLYTLQKNEMHEIYTFSNGEVTGNLPFSRGWTSTPYGEASVDTHILSLPQDKYHYMICTHFELTRALVNIMTTRVRDYTALQQQNEKMMSLGKLSAGLAHELNNPVSAVVRGATSLKEHIQLVRYAFQKVVRLGISAEKIDLINKLLGDILKEGEHTTLSLMERNEREDDMNDWLEDLGIENADIVAETFVEFNLTVEKAESIKSDLPDADLSAVFNWLSNSLVSEKIVKDIEEGSQRISGIVSSVKTFTHMDQAREKQYGDIHKGLRSTLIMLNYKIQKGNIKIIESFDETLPLVKAMIGELNQVWTNLIDNAIDAMDKVPKPVLEIITKQDNQQVCVTIKDNGEGIPDELRTQIFDPFFTTKEVGKGTGLGLDVVQRIIRQHKGMVKIESVPGNTQFTVCFPIND